MKHKIPLYLPLAAALSIFCGRPLRADVAAAIDYRNLEVLGCQGGQMVKADALGNIITHTTKPSFDVMLTTVGSPGLVGRVCTGANRPQPTTTNISGVQDLWNLDGNGNDSGGGARTLGFTVHGLNPGACTGAQFVAATNGLGQAFSPSYSASGNECMYDGHTASNIPFQSMAAFTVEVWVKRNSGACHTAAHTIIADDGLPYTCGEYQGDPWVQSCQRAEGTCDDDSIPGPPTSIFQQGMVSYYYIQEADWPILGQCENNGTSDKCLHIVLRDNRTNGGLDCKSPVLATGRATPYFGFGNDDVCGGNIPSDGTWHHLAFVVDNSNQKSIYLDGKLASGANINTAAKYNGAPATTYIGGFPSGSNNVVTDTFANGAVDAVRIYSTALNQTVIAAHALGQYFNLGDTNWTFGGDLSGQFCGGLPQETAPGPYYNWSWGFGARPTGIGQGGQDASVPFSFMEEDTTEATALYTHNVQVNQQTMSVPPTIVPDSVYFTSQTWTIPTWFCDTANTAYSFLHNNITDPANGSIIAGSPITDPTQASKSSTFTALSVNTRYAFSTKATYTDTGGSGLMVGPSALTTLLNGITLAWAPGAPALNLAGAADAQLTLDMSSGTVHAPLNPPYTSIDLEGSTDDTNNNNSWSPIFAFAAANTISPATPQTPTVSIGYLTRSRKYYFRSRTANLDSVSFSSSENSVPLVTQPASPTGLNGSPPADPLFCAKNSIRWSWNPVVLGSHGYPYTANVNIYRVSQFNADHTMTYPPGCSVADGSTSCSENGLTPGQVYTRVVQAQDPGVTNPLWVWSSTVNVANASTLQLWTDAPQNIAGTPTTVNAIQWNWTKPTHICASFEYRVTDAQTGNLLITLGDHTAPTPTSCPDTGCPDPTWTQGGQGVNTLHSIKVKAIDNYGTSPLSDSATAYTRANPPLSLAAASISTGSLLLNWDTNGNPAAYTRYEVLMSQDINFLTGVTTLASISDNLTSASLPLPVTGLNAGTNYYFRVRAANGRASDNYGGMFTAPANLATITLAQAPTGLTGFADALSGLSGHWSWDPSVSATKYWIYAGPDYTSSANPVPDSVATSYPFPDAANLFPVSAPNTSLQARVRAENASGLGPFSAPAAVFTFAAAPTINGANGFMAVTSNTVTLSWNTNNNAAHTLFEVSVATDVYFGVVAATVSATGNTTTVGGLFPGATYYARVRAFNGASSSPQSQTATIFAPVAPIFISTRTDFDSQITRSSAPASPYEVPAGLVGLWHFDESSGTAAGDASGWGNTGQTLCMTPPVNNCVASNSTPTFITDTMIGLGHAVSFAGRNNSLLSIPHAARYNSSSLTVSAWAKPALSAVQANGAGIVSKGTLGNAAFSLEIGASGGQRVYQFRLETTAGAATISIFVRANTPIRPGQWDLVTGILDGVSHTVALYINGAFVANASIAGLTPVSSGLPIVIGNKNDGTDNYTLGFSGAIDDVRIYNTALSAAQVTALYNSYIPAVLTPPGINSKISLLLPPDAFRSAASIYMSDDPVNHPIRVSITQLAQALSRTPTGQMLVPGSLLEIVPTLDGVSYFSGPLGSSAILSVPYPDANGDGVVDGTNPPLPVSKLQLYTLDSTVMAWNALPSTVDTVNKQVWAQISHFSVFALLGATSYGKDISEVRVYPVPWKLNSSDKFGGRWLYFDGLPQSGFIRIMTLSGEKVVEVPFSNMDAGALKWDGRNAAGKPVASGVYFAQVKSAVNGSSRILKFAIEK